MTSQRQKGFTILELMIATAVFASLLLVILIAVTQIGKMYYKGITTSRTQEAARAIVDDIAQQLQYSSDQPTPIAGIPGPLADGASYSFCFGRVRYIMIANRQVSQTPGAGGVVNQARHGLWTDRGGIVSAVPCDVSDVNMSAAQPSSAALGGRDILPDGLRITDFAVRPLNTQGTLWQVKVRVAYGNQDLLEAFDGTPLNSSNFTNAVCKGAELGTQFCAVSELDTTVYRRILR